MFDITNLISKDWLPAQDDLSKNLLNVTGKMVGFVAAIWAAKKAWQAFKGVQKVSGFVGDVVSGKKGKGGLSVLFQSKIG